LLARKPFNVVVEGVVGAVPVVGDLFDVSWRANRRKVRLLREYFEREGLVRSHHELRDAICARVLAECLLTYA
jgi:hypothetical protein